METMSRVPGCSRSAGGVRRTAAFTGMRLAAAALILLTVTGCRRDHSRPAAGEAETGGTLVVSTGADADVLLPAVSQSLQSQQVAQLMFDLLALPPASLSTFGDEGFIPALAERWEWSTDSLSIAFHLHPEARWHDGHRVTAADVAFTHRLYVDPQTASHSAPVLGNIDSVTVRDSLTAVFWFRQRDLEQFFHAAYHMRIHPKHLLDTIPPAQLRSSAFARHPIGSGPFRFSRWTPGTLIELVADTTHYRGRPRLDRVIWTIAPDPTTLITRVLNGEADFTEMLRAESMDDFARSSDVRAVPYPSLLQIFLTFNVRAPGSEHQPHPLFADRELRRALSMAVDRETIVRNVYDSLGVVGIGPVNRVMLGADTVLGHIPYDIERARQLLDSLGWRARADGVRERNGRALRFSLLVPTSSAPRMRMAVLLQEQMRQVGARVDVEQMEFNAFADRQRARRFDAVLITFVMDPSPMSLRETWSTAAGRPGGANYGAYSSARFDALLDSAGSRMSPGAARSDLLQAYATLLEDAPAVFIAEGVNYAGIHRRLEPGPIRADGWWLTLSEWSIPADRRIARDALPGPTAAR
jgi:peptide/nickel transport system substrate-binding protein